MFRIKEKLPLSKTDLKCLELNPLIVGGNSKEIINVAEKKTTPTNAGVSSILAFDDGHLFGLSDGRIGFLNKTTGEEYANLHSSNICTIDSTDNTIVTGSWDKNACVLYPTTNNLADIVLNNKYYKKHMFPHPAGVWTVKMLDNNTFLTGCADGIIRMFRENRLYGELAYHANAARQLVYIDENVISVDNYGKVLKFNLSKGLLKSRNLDEMCFCMCIYNDLLLIGGENGQIFFLNQEIEVLDKIKLPCTTCWSIKTDGTLVYVCGSDGILYIIEKGVFTSEQVVSNVENNKNEQQDAIEQSDKKIQKDGIFVSEGVKYKVENGKIYQEVGNTWQPMGDVTAEYDQSFTVELSGKNYTLSFNNKDNSHEVATKFLQENKISQEHHQDIVNYIEQNFKKNTLFKYYDSIDMAGITKFLGEDTPIVQVMSEITNGTNYSLLKKEMKNLYEIEMLLADIPLFIKLDLCKYLIYKKIYVDLSFLFKINITNKKEAKAFIYLMTNLVEDPPFSLVGLRMKIRSLRDYGLLNLDDVKWFESNCDVRSVK